MSAWCATLSKLALSLCLVSFALAVLAAPTQAARADDPQPVLVCDVCAVLCSQKPGTTDECIGKCKGEGVTCPIGCGCSDKVGCDECGVFFVAQLRP